MDNYNIFGDEEEDKRGDDNETKCFAYIDETHCNALTVKECNGCPFFKLRSEVKNNPFYGFSYENRADHLEDMEKHKINPEDVIY